jgi:ankyrin repeat protein
VIDAEALRPLLVTVVRQLAEAVLAAELRHDPAVLEALATAALAAIVPGQAATLAAHPDTKTEVRNAKDESVLMLAALKGYLPLVQKLVNNDADVNKTGWTPLHYAASGGHVPVIAHLLDHSAYIDAESPNGTTPLMMAAMYGSPEAVKHLIQAGADLRLKNQLGLTALDFAIRGQRKNAKELIENGLARLSSLQKP